MIISWLLKNGEYTTSAGERWGLIDVPGFRQTTNPAANQFVSSHGRIMTNSGVVTSATNDYMKISVPTKGIDESAPGHSTLFGLHVIVCYRFHGGPPSPYHTVDHINRKHWDNYYGNLRWASPEEQLNNRDFLSFTTIYDGQEYNTIKGLSCATGKRPSAVRGMLKQDDESVFHIVKKHKVPMAPVVGLVSRVLREKKNTHQEVFERFVDRAETVETISSGIELKSSTVITYLIKAVREGSLDDRRRFCQRIALTSKDKFDRLVQAVEQFRTKEPSKEEWETHGPRLYLSVCDCRYLI